MSNTPIWQKQHYNAVAKEIREQLDASLTFHNNWSELQGYDSRGRYYATEALVVLAINFAKRFQKDNENFDPLRFLDACSPDTNLYPLSELWWGDS